MSYELRTPSTPIDVAPLRFFDLETTGLHAGRGGRITEVALLGWKAECVHRVFDPESGGYDAAMREVLVEVGDVVGSGVVVAHNAPFDVGFLAYEAGRLGVAGPSVRFIDTLALARRCIDDVSDYRLGTLAARLGLPVEGDLHTARTDAHVVRSLFEYLMAIGDLDTLGDAGLQRVEWRR